MDDETRDRFDALDRQFADILAAIGQGFGRADARFDVVDRLLDTILAHLEEQDAGHERLMGKVDRLAARVDQLSMLAHAGEEAMTALDALSRRVARLEAERDRDA